MTNIESAQPLYMLKISSPDIDVVDRAEGPYTDDEGSWRRDILLDSGAAHGVEWVRYRADLPEHVPSAPGMLPIFLFMRGGTVRVLEFDCNAESAFQALERVYRSPYPNDFEVSDVLFIRFQ